MRAAFGPGAFFLPSRRFPPKCREGFAALFAPRYSRREREAAMNVTRRTVSLGLVAAGLSGSASAGRAPVLASSSSPVAETAPRPRPDSGYDAWVRAFQGRASSKGISTATLDAAFRGAGYLPKVIENDQSQFESRRTRDRRSARRDGTRRESRSAPGRGRTTLLSLPTETSGPVPR